ncbi:MAG: zinc-dependent peptidase [Bdellovibrionales bacterium]|nr:zinc-dependent peptidase [Bdellovibrionales bacterium]
MQTFIILLAAIISFTIFFQWWRRYDRRMLRASAFPEKWREFLNNQVPLYARLPDELKRELEGHIQVFLSEKYFEGAGGLEITDEMRVTVAAQACVLLLGRNTNYYPQLSSIIIYPAAYIAEHITHEGLVEIRDNQVRLGEAWHRGSVVLSWSDVHSGANDIKDGHNVVLHEFAHLLDFEDGRADGVPPLDHRSSYVSWARVMAAEFERLQLKAASDKKSVLDHYGATNPAEFFAVAVEAFYEKPEQLKRKRPELYEELQAFFKVDPAEWARA